MLNVILFLNLIVAQLANAYKKLKKRGKVFYLLTTLSVREISEADDKYSSVISVFFPISTLNLVFGSIVLAAKSPTFNLVMLHIYFLPVILVVLTIFIAYQAIILPFAYIKVVGHKFALMVSGPSGSGDQTTLDRFGNAILFIIIGPILLTFSAIVDIFWFLAHVYKMDLDKSVSKKVFTYDKEEESLPLHRRTYKKMLMYFQTQNDQLVKLKDVSEDLRDYFDVFEGIRCMLYGKPDEIPKSKMGLYVAYSHFKRANKDEGVSNDAYFEVEKVAREYTTIKQVLLNNSIPVDIVSLESGLQKRKDQLYSKGWGMQTLFDKKAFMQLLTELEQMRKLHQVKKKYYLFNTQYYGKPTSSEEQYEWYEKVEMRTTQTLKFVNLARLLQIIRYDPV